MLKTFLTLFVFTSAGLAQSSSDRPLSGRTSRKEDSSFYPIQICRVDSFYSRPGELASGVMSSASVPLPTIHKEVQEVNLTFTVTDHHGRFVRNLVPSDFMIRDNDQPPERITYFESQSELPLRLAIVIDSSDSVANVFKDEKRSAIDFLKRIVRRTSDLALVMGFNQEVQLVQGPTSDDNVLSHAIRQLRNGGNTAIYDAVSAASQQLATVEDTQAARRAIILITDGEDNSSHINLGLAKEVVQRNECTVYVISINLAGYHREELELAMKELSGGTGGTFIDVHTTEDMTTALSRIDKELRNQYLISYKPAGVSPDGSFHRIVVVGPKKLRIHHRAGYFAK